MRTKAVIWTESEARAYRGLMEMRGISVKELAAEMAKAPASVRGLLLGTRGRRGPTGRIRIRPGTLATLDSAITRITDRKGGVYAACGSTPAGVAEAVRLLAASA